MDDLKNGTSLTTEAAPAVAVVVVDVAAVIDGIVGFGEIHQGLLHTIWREAPEQCRDSRCGRAVGTYAECWTEVTNRRHVWCAGCGASEKYRRRKAGERKRAGIGAERDRLAAARGVPLD